MMHGRLDAVRVPAEPRLWPAAVLVLVCAVSLLAVPASSQQISTMVTAPDGVGLATDVYLPQSGEPWPAVLIRTPYGKNQMRLDCYALNLYGYACVVQDTRGRFASEGENTVFRDDATDGRATLDWIIQQPWSNQAVATFGASASGINQYILAPVAGPALRCMVPIVAAPDLYPYAVYQGGAQRQSLMEGWLATQNALDWLDEAEQHRMHDDWWTPLEMASRADQVTAGALHAGGWFDVFGQGTLDAFTVLQRQGAGSARQTQYLLMGPWTHVGTNGALSYSNGDEYDVSYLAVPFLDHCLRGESNQVDDWPIAQIYLMGASGEPGAPGNYWMGLDAWPPPSTPVSLYLGSDQGLSFSQQATGEVELLIDPSDPVPTFGGPNLFPNTRVDGRVIADGPQDQSLIEARDDVLTFTTDILDEPLTIMGRVHCTLWIRPDTLDLDLAVRLTDVYPDGRSMLMLDGIQRARMRCGDTVECLLTPGQPTEITVDLWSTALVFNQGHRIRVSISGTNAPRFEVNPNNGAPFDSNEPPVVARPAILTGPQTPSRLVLPVPLPPRSPARRVEPAGLEDASALRR